MDGGAFDALGADAFSVPAFRAVHEAIRAAGGLRAAIGQDGARGPADAAAWVERVRDEAATPVAGLVTELAVTPLPEDRPDALEDYVRGVVDALVDLGMTRQIAEARGRLQRMDPVEDADAYGAAFADLVAIEGRRRALRRRD
ncbi:MAG: primase [Actinotalea sp.]|nr:primase [Actinotalea sp.]